MILIIVLVCTSLIGVGIFIYASRTGGGDAGTQQQTTQDAGDVQAAQSDPVDDVVPDVSQ
jgi:hypothetical protein